MLGIKHILKLLFERKELFLGFKIVKKWAWILILVFKLLKSLQKAKIDFFLKVHFAWIQMCKQAKMSNVAK